MMGDRQWVLARFTCALMLLPLAVIFYVVTIGNLDAGPGKLLVIYISLIGFTLGWPVWALIAAYLIARRRVRGIVWMRNLCAFLLVVALPVTLYLVYDPHFLNSDLPQAPAVFSDRLLGLAATVLFVLPAYFSGKLLKQARA